MLGANERALVRIVVARSILVRGDISLQMMLEWGGIDDQWKSKQRMFEAMARSRDVSINNIHKNNNDTYISPRQSRYLLVLLQI